MRLQKDYNACIEGKVLWKFPRVTVTVTVKATEVNAQSPLNKIMERPGGLGRAAKDSEFEG